MLASTLRSLRDVFPWVSVWCVGDGDLVFPRLGPPAPARRGRPHATLREGAARRGPGRQRSGAWTCSPIHSSSWRTRWHLRKRSRSTGRGARQVHIATCSRAWNLPPPVPSSWGKPTAFWRRSTSADRLSVARACTSRSTCARFRSLRGSATRSRIDSCVRIVLSAGSESLALAQLSATEAGVGGARRIARAPEVEGVWLLARELGRELRVERSVAVCQSYLELASQALVAEASVFTRPATEAFEREIDTCASTHPENALEWWASMVPALNAAWAPERALARFRRLEADAAPSRLDARTRALLQLEAARALVRLGHRREARARVQRRWPRSPPLRPGGWRSVSASCRGMTRTISRPSRRRPRVRRARASVTNRSRATPAGGEHQRGAGSCHGPEGYTRPMAPRVTIVGGGLAGCEAAWQLARRGVAVDLFEMRPERQTPVHRTGDLAELVCSNSLRGNALDQAAGLLKEEMRRMGSLVVRVADAVRVPAGSALAVDRELFARRMTEAIESLPLVTLHRRELVAHPRRSRHDRRDRAAHGRRAGRGRGGLRGTGAPLLLRRGEPGRRGRLDRPQRRPSAPRATARAATTTSTARSTSGSTRSSSRRSREPSARASTISRRSCSSRAACPSR